MKNTVFFLIGGNLGDRLCLIEQAEILIEKKIGHILKKSSIFESSPWGFSADTNFLNTVLIVETEQTPLEVLNNAQNIENDLGRERKTRGYSSRTMDIDILFFNDLIKKSKYLIIPHPKLHERRFTLLPLQEIAPHKIHPVFGISIERVAQNCTDQTTTTLFKKR